MGASLPCELVERYFGMGEGKNPVRMPITHISQIPALRKREIQLEDKLQRLLQANEIASD